MYFMLQNEYGEDRLYFYDNPKRTKPRGLIDLSCSYLYQVTIISNSFIVQESIKYYYFSNLYAIYYCFEDDTYPVK